MKRFAGILLLMSSFSHAQEMQKTFNEGRQAANEMMGKFELKEIESIPSNPESEKQTEAALDLITTSFKTRPQIVLTEKDLIFGVSDEFELADGGDLKIEGKEGKSDLRTCHETRITPQKKCQVIQHVEVEEIIEPAETKTLEFFRGIDYKPHGNAEDMLFNMKHKDRWFNTNWDNVRKPWKAGPLNYYLNETNSNSNPKFTPLLSYIFLKTGFPKDRIDLVSYRSYFIDRYSPRKHIITFHKLEKRSYKLHEKVINECEGLEKIGYRLKQSTCLEGSETRVFADQKVTRDCWREERLYEASNRTTGNCGPLQETGCKQIDSHCLDADCQTLEQIYECGDLTEKVKIEKGPTPFCLTGNCMSDDEEFDDEMARALTELAIIEEMGNGAKNTRFKFFSGEAKSCKDELHKHCCAKNSGVGVSTGLSNCSTEEKQLAQKMAAGLCVYSRKKTIKKGGFKVGTKKTYCCFPSKLSRMLNEQGRSQLRRDFKDCAGFNISEIQSLDFDRMDLSGAFSEIKITPIDANKINHTIKQNLEQKVRNM